MKRKRSTFYLQDHVSIELDEFDAIVVVRDSPVISLEPELERSGSRVRDLHLERVALFNDLLAQFALQVGRS